VIVPHNCQCSLSHSFLLGTEAQTVQKPVMDGTQLFPEGLDPLVDVAAKTTPIGIANDVSPGQEPKLGEHMVHEFDGHLHIQLEAGRME